MAMGRQGWRIARGLRALTRDPVGLAEASTVIAAEVRDRGQRLLETLDRLVWPVRECPVRQLLDHAGVEPGDLRRLVGDLGVEGGLDALRDQGVYVSYEEYHGRVDARRGSATFSFRPEHFFNPVTAADYLAATGGSRSTGTPVEVSFAWQRRQATQRPIQYELAGVRGAPSAVWLPVFPSAAGFGAVMKMTAGGSRPERWFSQVPTSIEGIASHKQAANRFLPALNALARTGLPSPEHVPTGRAEVVLDWLVEARDRAGNAIIHGYASSLTSVARLASTRGVDLTGVAAFPASEPVTSGKLAAMRATGMDPYAVYAFVPEGTMGLSCPACADEEYHLWSQDLAVTTRVRPRSDGVEVSALLLTSLAVEAPRVLLNVENDDYGAVRHDVDCDCLLGELGLTTRVANIRGLTKVVAAGISLDGEVFDHLAEVALPHRLGGGPGDYQFVEEETLTGTVVSLRIHPGVGPVDTDHARTALSDALAGSDNGVLARSVWNGHGQLRIDREPPVTTAAGKMLAFERLGSPAPRARM